MEIITGVERRRRWRPEQKLRIHPASPAYRVAAEPVLCSYVRSCERR